ncbi:UNVERIFIED_CONTAM: hypothetical protein RMT77_017281 [Armadillidium vulgare]
MRPTIRVSYKLSENELEDRGLTCGRTSHGFLIRTKRQHIKPCPSYHSWLSIASPCRTINRTHLTLLPATFSYSSKNKSALKGTGFASVDAVKAKAMSSCGAYVTISSSAFRNG